MSFSSEQKKEIIGLPMKSVCCRRAFLFGVFAAKGEIRDGFITLNLETREMCDFISSLTREIFGKEGFISSPPHGGRCVFFSLENRHAERILTDLLSGDNLSPILGCATCKSAFLRGVYFSVGRVCDPQKEYLLELSLGKRAGWFLPIFEEAGLFFKLSKRREETLLYFKKSENIEDFFVNAGMNKTAFYFMNSKIESKFRSDANRVANCETNNIEKAISASKSQTDVIRRLESEGLLSSLPPELEKTARLRLENPDLSLFQLANLSVPPITKSGLSHRMNRIELAAKELLKNR